MNCPPHCAYGLCANLPAAGHVRCSVHEDPLPEWGHSDRLSGVWRGIRFRANRPVHLAETLDGGHTACGRSVPNDVDAVLLVWRNETDRCRTCERVATETYLCLEGPKQHHSPLGDS